MKITRKKQLRYREINREERIKYHHKILNFIKKIGTGLTQYRYIWCKNYHVQDISTIHRAVA